MTDTNILKVELLFDSSMDDGFKSIIENKMKSIDLKGLTKAIQGQKVIEEEFTLENKEIEDNLIRYCRHLVGSNISECVKHIKIKFPEELTMEIYWSN